MHDWLLTLQDYHIVPILYTLGIALILIDYFLPTDVTCQFGYFALAAAVFFQINLSAIASLAIGAVVWAVLVALHFTVFHRFLENVPDNPPADVSRPADSGR
jgi:membrane protein implicated in regulation of membrane protease activity